MMKSETCQEFTQRLEAAVAAWDQLCSHVVRDALEWQPSEEVWSIKQVTLHVADGLEATLQRIHAMLTEDTPMLLAFDADQWAQERLYHQRPWSNARDCLKQRATHLKDVVADLTDTMLERSGRHRRIAEILGLPGDLLTVADLLRFEVGHIEEHLLDMNERAQAYTERMQ